MCAAILGGVKFFECSTVEEGVVIWQSWLESFLAAHLTWHGIMEAWLMSTCSSEASADGGQYTLAGHVHASADIIDARCLAES